ncbi:MAG TPA: CheR family methyltransferase, partial [Stellaceae bacterium]|nr:CheR family methyltransferase [Stellaceae bacterium]
MEEAQLAQARELVGERLGLEFPGARDDELCAGLLASAARLRLPSVETLLDRLAATGWRHREWGVVASRLTIGETCFFRNAASFEALKAHVLEPLIAERRRQGCRMLSLLSAGCASGEEAYSLAILIDRLIPDREDWLIRIFATDINPAAMAAARAGIYRAWSLREVPPQVRQLYFVRRGTRFEIAGNIRDRVSVAPFNLAAVDDDSALGLAGFDLILCRNVLMYLLPAARQRAVRRLAAALAPSGWLMTAPAEAVPELFAPLSSVVCGDAMLFRAEPPSASLGPRAKQPLPAAAPASPAAGPRP